MFDYQYVNISKKHKLSTIILRKTRINKRYFSCYEFPILPQQLTKREKITDDSLFSWQNTCI